MKYVPDSVLGIPQVQLTRRNLLVLLEKLDMPDSARTIIDRTNTIAVTAVEDADHYSDRQPGPMLHKDGSIE